MQNQNHCHSRHPSQIHSRIHVIHHHRTKLKKKPSENMLALQAASRKIYLPIQSPQTRTEFWYNAGVWWNETHKKVKMVVVNIDYRSDKIHYCILHCSQVAVWRSPQKQTQNSLHTCQELVMECAMLIIVLFFKNFFVRSICFLDVMWCMMLQVECSIEARKSRPGVVARVAPALGTQFLGLTHHAFSFHVRSLWLLSTVVI